MEPWNQSEDHQKKVASGYVESSDRIHCLTCRWARKKDEFCEHPQNQFYVDGVKGCCNFWENEQAKMWKEEKKATLWKAQHCGPCSPVKAEAVHMLSDLKFKADALVRDAELCELAKLSADLDIKPFADYLCNTITRIRSNPKSSGHAAVLDKLEHMGKALYQIQDMIDKKEISVVDKQGMQKQAKDALEDVQEQKRYELLERYLQDNLSSDAWQTFEKMRKGKSLEEIEKADPDLDVRRIALELFYFLDEEGYKSEWPAEYKELASWLATYKEGEIINQFGPFEPMRTNEPVEMVTQAPTAEEDVERWNRVQMVDKDLIHPGVPGGGYPQEHGASMDMDLSKVIKESGVNVYDVLNKMIDEAPKLKASDTMGIINLVSKYEADAKQILYKIKDESPEADVADILDYLAQELKKMLAGEKEAQQKAAGDTIKIELKDITLGEGAELVVKPRELPEGITDLMKDQKVLTEEERKKNKKSSIDENIVKEADALKVKVFSELAKARFGKEVDDLTYEEFHEIQRALREFEPVSASMNKESYIRHEDGKWKVFSESGKLLGTHDTKEKAQKQLQAIEISKHKGSIGVISQSKSETFERIHDAFRSIPELDRKRMQGTPGALNDWLQSQDVEGLSSEESVQLLDSLHRAKILETFEIRKEGVIYYDGKLDKHGIKFNDDYVKEEFLKLGCKEISSLKIESKPDFEWSTYGKSSFCLDNYAFAFYNTIGINGSIYRNVLQIEKEGKLLHTFINFPFNQLTSAGMILTPHMNQYGYREELV